MVFWFRWTIYLGGKSLKFACICVGIFLTVPVNGLLVYEPATYLVWLFKTYWSQSKPYRTSITSGICKWSFEHKSCEKWHIWSDHILQMSFSSKTTFSSSSKRSFLIQNGNKISPSNRTHFKLSLESINLGRFFKQIYFSHYL